MFSSQPLIITQTSGDNIMNENSVIIIAQITFLSYGLDVIL